MVKGQLGYLVPKSERVSFHSHTTIGTVTTKPYVRFCSRKIIRCICLAVLFIITIQVIQLFVSIQYNAIPHLFYKKVEDEIALDTLEEINIPMPSNQSFRGYSRLQCQCETNRDMNLQGPVSDGQSFCSKEATEYGKGQRVISYSLFVSEQEAVPYFLDGIVPNLQNLQDIFPGWLTRIYTNVPINNRSCSFICEHDTLFWCDITNIPQLGDISAVNGRIWRFMPIGDPTVDIFISRDLDSITSIRERIAVSEWESSNKTFHVIRDSNWHDTEILAGLWGAKNTQLTPKAAQSLRSQFITNGKKNQDKNLDQTVLRRSLFYPYLNDILAHDSYFCRKYAESRTLPFSTRRIKEEFVGHDDLKEMRKLFVGRLKPCPQECRPTYGQNWTYC